MINQFIDEVISTGPEAVLPHNLDSVWLDKIYIAAKNYLKTAAGSMEEQKDAEFLGDDYSLIMLSAVTEIAHQQSGYTPEDNTFEIPEDVLFEYISCYSLSIMLESIAREGEIEIAKPTLESIFDRERLYETEENNPELTEVLNSIILS